MQCRKGSLSVKKVSESKPACDKKKAKTEKKNGKK